MLRLNMHVANAPMSAEEMAEEGWCEQEASANHSSAATMAYNESAPERWRRCEKEGERKAKGRERNLLRREIEKNSESKLAKQWFTLGQRSK